MPLLTLQTNQQIDESQLPKLLQEYSAAVAAALGKPERYVMVRIEPNAAMLFAGEDSACAHIELKSLGLPESTTPELSSALCQLTESTLSIPTERIYIEFSSPARHMWGWNSGTF